MRCCTEPRDVELQLELEHRDDTERGDRQEIGECRRLDIVANTARRLIDDDSLGELVAGTEHQRAVRIAELLRAVARVHEVEEPQRAARVDLRGAGAGGGEEQLQRSLDGADLGACCGEHGCEPAEHVVHHGEDERVAIREVDVERTARQVRSRADRIEAGVEAAGRELLEACGDQREAGGFLGLGS